jgi:hypothetical protein
MTSGGDAVQGACPVSNRLEQRIKANLNLYAVLQNLDDLLRLDPDAAARAKDWCETIQFSVLGGPEAYLEFKDGACTHGRGKHGSPTISLYFATPWHLNQMFDGKAIPPVPLKGFRKLGFLSKEFTPLTKRLEYFLKPNDERLSKADYRKLNTIMTFHTALFAVGELAQWEPVSKQLAAHMGTGVLQMSVLPDGPHVSIEFGGNAVSVKKGEAANPRARMAFRDVDVANALLNNKVDGFQAVVQSDVTLKGYLPMLENINLILDRVHLYLA